MGALAPLNVSLVVKCGVPALAQFLTSLALDTASSWLTLLRPDYPNTETIS